MNKFIIFLVLFTTTFLKAQETASNFSEISTNYDIGLGTGNFSYNVPLFSLPTVNNNFIFNGSANYNSSAAANFFTSEGSIAKGWSLDFIPSIYRKIDSNNKIWDEIYLEPSLSDLDIIFDPGIRDNRINDLFQFNIFGLNGSFRLKYNANNTITVDKIDGSGYYEVIPQYTITSNGIDGKKINLISFSIVDINGNQFIFNDYDITPFKFNFNIYELEYNIVRSVLNISPIPDYGLYKKSFLLSTIKDKYNNNLVEYIYKSYSTTFDGFTYDQKVIDKIQITKLFELIFETNKSKINSLTINNTFTNNVHQKINLNKSSIQFLNSENVLEKKYTFSYFGGSYPNNPTTNSYGNLLKSTSSGECIDESLTHNDQIQDYKVGLLKTIILPLKGKMEIDYEINTYGASNTIKNEKNYEYIQVPITYNFRTGNYKFIYENIDTNNGEGYYLKYDSTPVFYPITNSTVTPYLSVKNSSGAATTIGQDGRTCTYGGKIPHNTGFVNNTLQIYQHQNLMSNVTNIIVYKKVLKPENQRVKYLFGPGVRVKSVLTYDENNNIAFEKNYKYHLPNDPLSSSGLITNALWFTHTANNTNKPLPVYYKYVTIEEPNKGKTVYEMNSDQFLSVHNSPFSVAFQPKSIWTYTISNELKEHTSNTFEYFKLSPLGNNIFKKINSITKTYEGSHFKELHTEKTFDETHRKLTNTKVIDVLSGETFEEKFTYQKLGNAYYQTSVEKFRNNSLLNKSVFEYIQVNGLAYELSKSNVAKSTLPLETVKEITRYDVTNGNILEYKNLDGSYVSQIWGYEGSSLVAVLQGVAYSSISSSTINQIKTYSSKYTYNESLLRTALNSLRTSFPNAFVTTHIYAPMKGIIETTDSNGIKESYQYDSFNRPYRTLNNDGIITKEIHYNIKN